MHKIFQDRAKMLTTVRSFFSKKNILEVDTPSIGRAPSIDAYIEIMETAVSKNEIGYLQTSPEYFLKRLLSLGFKDIYQMGHVFRKEEIGDLHNPEFMLVEWYRSDMDYEIFIKEVTDFIFLFLKKMPIKKDTYKKTFLQYTQIDCTKAKKEDLYQFLKEKNVKIPDSLNKDSLLQLILSYFIEPHLGKDHLFILDNYPPSQAALAQIVQINDEPVAKRFEIYHGGIELANGFLELNDPIEQRKRFILENKKREKLKKKPLLLDENFLKALEKGIGNCKGVAVGFDRLMMLRHQKKSIKDVIFFPWNY